VSSLFGVTQCYSYSKIKCVIINRNSAWRIPNKSSVKSRTHKLCAALPGKRTTIFMYVYMYVCTYVCMHVCIYICTCVYMYACTHLPTACIPAPHPPSHPSVCPSIYLFIYLPIICMKGVKVTTETSIRMVSPRTENRN
jgi:hypothetical protein